MDMKNPERINELIITALESGKIKINDAATLVKVMEFQEKYLEKKCENCKYRIERPQRTIGEALAAFLSEEE
jgi:predicted aldo/keto reductase-like oxidoreductase